MSERPPKDVGKARFWFIILGTMAISAIVSLYTPITLLFLVVPLVLGPFLFRKKGPK